MWLGPRQAPVFTGGVLEGSSSSFGSKCSGASRRRQAFNVRANRAAGMVTRVNRLYYAAMLGLKRGEIRIDLGSSVLLLLVAPEGPCAAETHSEQTSCVQYHHIIALSLSNCSNPHMPKSH
jgi:hypothetical protein